MNTNILIPSKAAWRPQPSTGEQTIDGVCPRFDQITPQFRDPSRPREYSSRETRQNFRIIIHLISLYPFVHFSELLEITSLLLVYFLSAS